MGARRLGQDEQYLTVREILSEASTLADGALSRERSDFYRFGYVMLGFNLLFLSWLLLPVVPEGGTVPPHSVSVS